MFEGIHTALITPFRNGQVDEEALRAHIERLEVERELDQWKSPLDGQELMERLDRPPGRWIGEVKDHLRELVIDGELEAGDKERALEIARELLAGN